MGQSSTGVQIPLALQWDPDFAEKSFIVSPANEAAFLAVTSPEKWPSPVLAIIGESGTGKSHLAHIWARRISGDMLVFPSSAELNDVTIISGGGVLLEDADTYRDDVLFGLINTALTGQIQQLLLISQTAPMDWSVDIPDLRSRLRAVTTIEVESPDDELLSKIYRKLFADVGIKVGDDAIKSLVLHGERSVPAARQNVASLDELASSRKIKISRRLVSEYLGQQGKLFAD